jgi:hypothetical protein
MVARTLRVDPIVGLIAAMLAYLLTNVAYEAHVKFFQRLPELISAPPSLSDTVEPRNV